jgi:hypothetical protein
VYPFPAPRGTGAGRGTQWGCLRAQGRRKDKGLHHRPGHDAHPMRPSTPSCTRTSRRSSRSHATFRSTCTTSHSSGRCEAPARRSSWTNTLQGRGKGGVPRANAETRHECGRVPDIVARASARCCLSMTHTTNRKTTARAGSARRSTAGDAGQTEARDCAATLVEHKQFFWRASRSMMHAQRDAYASPGTAEAAPSPVPHGRCDT